MTGRGYMSKVMTDHTALLASSMVYFVSVTINVESYMALNENYLIHGPTKCYSCKILNQLQVTCVTIAK